jgi:hypothetical protein
MDCFGWWLVVFHRGVGVLHYKAEPMKGFNICLLNLQAIVAKTQSKVGQQKNRLP